MQYDNEYVYKAKVNWSLLTEGLTLPVNFQVIFARNMGKFLQRGDVKEITLYLYGTGYKAQIRNLNFNPKFKRKKDTLQIRYPNNGELAFALQTYFSSSYQYIKEKRILENSARRKNIRPPEGMEEYLSIYTTEYEDTYIIETIENRDIIFLKQSIDCPTERLFESSFDYDINDTKTGLLEDNRIVNIRKLNRKIGDNLKLLYDYRCQICGQRIGSEYDAHAVEAHHIDYFINSLNNDSSNQLIVCPNHHSIIHDIDPVFNRKKLLYIYPNGVREGLALNRHL